MRERGCGADLQRRDVGMGHVAVHILDLRQVLLGHVHELRGTHLVGEPRESLVKRWWVILLVMVLLRDEKETEKKKKEEIDRRDEIKIQTVLVLSEIVSIYTATLYRQSHIHQFEGDITVTYTDYLTIMFLITFVCSFDKQWMSTWQNYKTARGN